MDDVKLIKEYVPYEKQKKALKKLEKGYPVQYIIGNVDFYGNIIEVNKHVLIPRFETEYLVYKTIKYLEKLNINNPKTLEIGTGSGCISIALKKEIECDIDAIDISRKALSVAKKNAKKNDVKINFKVCDIHKYNSDITYDLIISNPPYVPFNSSVSEKIKYEPQNAIYAKDNGLHFYEVILKNVVNNLNKDYLIAFEIGDKEGESILKLAKKYLPKSYSLYEKDYNNYDRYLFISNKKLVD